MDILGIGFPELVLIFVILLLVMGPEDMQKAARTLGDWLRRVRTSAAWHSLAQLRAEMRHYFQELEHEMGERKGPEDLTLYPPAWDEGNVPSPSDERPLGAETSPGDQVIPPGMPSRSSSGEKPFEASSVPPAHPPETAP